MTKFDCVVCGEACVDLVIRPIDLQRPLASLETQHVEAIHVGTGALFRIQVSPCQDWACAWRR